MAQYFDSDNPSEFYDDEREREARERAAMLAQMGGAQGTATASAPPMFAPGELDPNRPAPDAGWQDTAAGIGALAQTMVPAGGKAPAPSYRDRLNGVDFGKFDNAEHTSPKYQIARVQAKYDPTQGITDQMLADLNALGIGTFSANKPGGDYLRVSGNVDPRFEGVYGSDIAIDGGKGGWNGWGGTNPEGPNGEALNGGGAPRQTAGGAMGGGGSSFDRIRGLMPTDTNFYNQLQAQLQKILGGEGATSRDALLALMRR